MANITPAQAMLKVFRVGSAILFSGAVSACSGTTDPDGTANADIDPEDNPHGYPACGNDPEKQPSPCIDEKLAVRCKTDSGFPGDELALCDVDPSEGVLIHMGPSDYTNTDEVAPWLLAPGDEEEFCQHITSTNTETNYWTSYHGRMRPHSHHWIVTVPKTPSEPEAAPFVCPPTAAIIDRWLFGSQSSQIDVQQFTGGSSAAEPGDPDYGLAHDYPPNQNILMDLHYVNTTEETLLREAWGTLEWVDPSEVEQEEDLLSWINLTINLPPLGHYVTPRVTCNVPKNASGSQEPVYLGLTTAHAHQRMIRTSVFHGKLDGSEDLIYESRNWHEPGEALFRDGEENPPLPVQEGQDWGAKSGFLRVEPGETVSWECEFQNDQNRVVTFGDTTKDEMCNIFGFYYPRVGDTWHCN